jgi:hypothetical protein
MLRSDGGYPLSLRERVQDVLQRGQLQASLSLGNLRGHSGCVQYYSFARLTNFRGST